MQMVLTFVYSAMNAGKSTALLQISHNYRERGMKTQLFIPSVIGVNRIVSRIGIESEAVSFTSADDMFDIINTLHNQTAIDCVLIDEAQFMRQSQVHQIAHIVDTLHIPIICYGLRTDFRGVPFEGSITLLSIADVIHEIKTVCRCGENATMTIRTQNGKVSSSGEQVLVGDNNMYESMCRMHWREALTRVN